MNNSEYSLQQPFQERTMKSFSPGKIVRDFATMRVGLTLLAIIIVLAVAGTIIPQEREIDAGPVLHFFYHTLELGSLYAANAMPNTISSPAPTASSFPGTKV